jgi:hypothetical protein
MLRVGEADTTGTSRAASVAALTTAAGAGACGLVLLMIGVGNHLEEFAIAVDTTSRLRTAAPYLH